MDNSHYDENLIVKLPKIVIIDDNPSNINLAATLLKKHDYDVLSALDGKSGIELVNREKPDLILLDIMMPELDGYEVCKILKNNTKTSEIPIVFLTALKETDNLVRSFEVGGVDYISKPFKKEELFARVKTHLELKRSRDIILSQNHKLHKLNDEKNNLMHITAHDLKNPLQGISGLIEMLQFHRHAIDDEEYESICQSINSSTMHALEIINDLLDAHAIEHGKFQFKSEKINLKEILDELYEHFINSANAKYLNLQFNLDNDVFVLADLSKFKRVLENIISNAIKFSPENKNISVNISNNHDYSIISVKDEGPGFTEEDKSKLFKKFTKLSARPTAGESSSGLGLSIVKSLLEVMNGRIELESESGKGAEFKIFIKKA